MEPATLAVVFVDADGVIRALDGATDRLGLGADIVGRPWEEAFPDWDMPDLRGGDAGELPCRADATAPSGQSVVVEFFETGAAEGAAGVSAIFRGDAALTLTDRQQQLCGLGEISASVGHEINNALTILRGWLDVMLEELDTQPPSRETVELLLGECERIARITRNLHQLSRYSEEATERLDIAELLSEVAGLVHYDMETNAIEIESDLGSGLPKVTGSSGRLKQAILNLLLNARQATPEGGKVTIHAERDEDGQVVVHIADTGCGIPGEIRKRVFNPFFTTKQTGTGLGLPVAKRIIEDHGGTVQLESEVD